MSSFPYAHATTLSSKVFALPPGSALRVPLKRSKLVLLYVSLTLASMSLLTEKQ